MKAKNGKILSFIRKPIPVTDKSQEEIIAERRRIRKEMLDKLLKRN